jgi:MFS transporter, DHA1 family, multidrug resistance protein
VLVFVSALGGVCMLGALATDLFQPALPAVAADLQAGTRAVQLTVTAVLLGMALGQLSVGPLSDSIGRRTPLLAGLVLFVVSSFLCTVAPSVSFLVVTRLLQGIAAATGVALANAMVADHFRGSEAARVLSRLVMVSLLPPVIGPLAGGQLLRVASWRWLFVVMAAVGVALLFAVALGLRESLPRERRAPLGVQAVFAGMGGLWRDAAFVGLTLSAALMVGAFFAYLTAGSLVIQDEYGVSPAAFGVLFSINAAGMVAATYLNHLLLARFSPRALAAAGVAGCMVAGVSALAVTVIGDLGLIALAVPLFLLVFSVGLALPDLTALALLRHPEKAGAAAAGYGTVRLGLASLMTPLVGLGGAIAVLPMTAVMAAAGIGSMGVLAVVWRRVGGARPQAAAPLTPGEAAEDVAIG